MPRFSLYSSLDQHGNFAKYAQGQHRLGRGITALAKPFALPSYHAVLVAVLVVSLSHYAYVPFWLIGLGLVSLGAQLPMVKAWVFSRAKPTLEVVSSTNAQAAPARAPKSYQVAQLAAFLFGVLGLFVSFGGISSEASVSFLLLCLFAKLWELNGKRDAYIVLNLCLFVLASAFLWSQGLALALLVFAGLVFVMLGFVALADDNNDTGAGRVRALSYLLLPSVPLLIVLFLFFPRLPPLWALPMSGKQATTGVSDSMSPGDFANLSKSTELAFRVEFDKSIPERHELYWRGLIFEDFDGTTWRPSQAPRDFWRSVDRNVPDWAAPVSGRSADNYRVILEPTYQNWLFGLDYSRPQPTRGVALTDDFTLGHYQPIGAQFRYALEYYPAAKVGLVLDEQTLTSTLALPDGNPKARTLAKEFYEKAGGDTQVMVSLIHQYIVDNAFRYTLSPPTLQDNRIDEFLFGTRAGFCEHYASSFVFLMRSAGVPARVVAGYQGGELGRDGKSWEVRQMDAHAWAEVWLENEGWVRVDPTAFVSPDRIEDGMSALTDTAGASMFGDGVVAQLGYRQFQLLQSVYRLSDQAGYYWQKQVVGYDQENQKNSLLQWFNITTLFGQVLMLAGLFALIMASIAGVFWYRRRHRYHALDKPIAALSAQISKQDKTLAKHSSESYLGYLERLASLQDEEGCDKLLGLAKRYRQARFGQVDENDPAHHQVVKQFAREIAKLRRYF